MMTEVRSDAIALGMSAEIKRSRCPATDSLSEQFSTTPAAMLYNGTIIICYDLVYYTLCTQ